MITSIKKILCLCLLATVAAGVETSLNAAETKATKTPAVPQKPAPVTITGKIVAVNKAAMTVTVDMKGKIGLFKLGPQVKLIKQGKEALIEELVAGQEISLTLREISYGKFEVVSVSVEPAQVASQPAGTGNGTGNATGNATVNSPFPSPPGPRNNEVIVISPNN